MTARWLLSLGISLALTLLIETVFALLCGKKGMPLVFVALANILTNPVVVCLSLIWRALALPAYPAAVAASEALAILAEGLIYQKGGGFQRPFLFSLSANALSFVLGLILSFITKGVAI